MYSNTWSEIIFLMVRVEVETHFENLRHGRNLTHDQSLATPSDCLPEEAAHKCKMHSTPTLHSRMCVSPINPWRAYSSAQCNMRYNVELRGRWRMVTAARTALIWYHPPINAIENTAHKTKHKQRDNCMQVQAHARARWMTSANRGLSNYIFSYSRVDVCRLYEILIVTG